MGWDALSLLTTAFFITVVPTVVPVVTHEGQWDAEAICTLILMNGTVLIGWLNRENV